MITSPWFERISMLAILINCITLGMYQPCNDNPCSSTRCIILQYLDHGIFIFFAVEMAIKIMAMGFFGHETYMAETWNRLDFFIVVAGTFEYTIATENLSLSAIRTIRVLRPLRAINRVPSMRILVMLLLDTLPMLGNVLLLCFFVFFIFGIVGVQLWKGVLRNRCFFDYNRTLMGDILDESFQTNYYKPEFSDSFICTEGGGMSTCQDIPPYINNSRICNGTIDLLKRHFDSNYNNSLIYEDSNDCVNWNYYYSKCRPSDKNPFKGAISFDNIGYAWVAIFQIISLESWVTIMYYIQDAHSFYDWIYFVFLIVIGSFFMINLCLVVIATQFSETKKRETERMIAERRRFSRSSSTLLSDSAGDPGSCWEELLKFLVHLFRKTKRRAFRKYAQYKLNRQKKLESNNKNSTYDPNTKPNDCKIKIIHEEDQEANENSLLNQDNNIPNNLILCNNIRHILHQEYQSELIKEILKLKKNDQDLDVDLIKCSHDNHQNYLYLFQNIKFNKELLTNSLIKQNKNKNNDEKNYFKMKEHHNKDECNLCKFINNIKINTSRNFKLETQFKSNNNKNKFANNINSNNKTMIKQDQQQPDDDFYFYCHFSNLDSLELINNKFIYQNHTSNKKILVNTIDNVSESNNRKRRNKMICCLSNQASSDSICVYFSKIRQCLKCFVDSKVFQRTILFAILINTLSMGIEHHEQPPLLTAIVEYSNIFFTVVFFIEMLLKLGAYGIFEYIKNAYNLFDGIIVGVSAYEVLRQLTSSTTEPVVASSGVSVLRTFRLLRILKLVRFMPALRRQLVVMLKTIDNVATFFSLLILFIFIFSILGMNLFGCKFCLKLSNNTKVCERKNFDSLLWAIITVFQVLTQEDWNEVLYNGMDKTSSWAALYFIALMTFGNYVLFNLLVAILVEGFSTEDEPKKIEDRIRQDAAMAIAEEQNRENSLRNQSNSHNNHNNQNGSKVSVDGSGSRPTKSIVKRSTRDSGSSKSQNKRPESESLNSMCRSNSRKSTNTNNTNSQIAFSSMNSSPKRNAKYLKSSQDLINQDNISRHSVVNFSSSITNISFKNDSLAVEYVSTTPSPFLENKRSKNKSKHQSSSSTSINRQTRNNNNLYINLPVITHTCATPINSPTNSPSRNSPIISKNNLNLNNNVLLNGGTFRKLSLDSANDRIKKSKSLTRLFSKSAAKIYDKKQSLPLFISNNETYNGKEAHTHFKVASIPKILISDTSKSDFRTQDTESIASSTSELTQIICPTLAIEESIEIDKLNDSFVFSSHIENEKQTNTKNNSVFGFKHRLSRSLRLPNESNKLSLPSNSFYNRRSKSEKIKRKSKRYNDLFLNKTINSECDNLQKLNEAKDQQTLIKNQDEFESNKEKVKHLENNINESNNFKNQITEKRKLDKKEKKKSSSSSKTKSNRAHSNKRSTSGTKRRHNTQRKTNKEETVSKAKNSSLLDPDEEEMIDFSCFNKMPEPRGCFITRKEYSLYLLSKENKFRVMCTKITTKKWFDYTILFLIAMNCITLAMERPNIPPNSFERKFLINSNYVFTLMFAIEMAIKVIAGGLYVGENAYLNSGWNVMDGFLVIISSIDAIISLTARSSPKIFGILRVFRLLRTLRPLRVISRAPGLKLVVQTLLSSLRPIGNIVLICCTFFIIFGILGVQLFKGKLYHCVGEVKDVKTKDDCLANPNNQWINSQYNFDNLGQALMALFVLSSKDGWVQIMYTGIDAVGVDKQPVENYNEWMLLYFISFLLLVGFFVLNMFVGVIIENFHKCREEQEREEKARRAAKRAKKFEEKRRRMKEIPYYANYSRMRRILHDICNSKYFDLIIAGVIGLNVVSMSLEFYMMPDTLDEILDTFNLIFTVIFLIEAIMRMVALGMVRYFKERWNQLDIIIVALSIVGIVFDKLQAKSAIPVNPTIIRVMRVLRIARVLKLLKMAKGIRSLLDTVIQALPQVGNLGLLFFLLFFIFAILGVELFGKLTCESIRSACDGLSKHAHFHNFGMAILTLFRIATGDNWNGIMKDTLKDNILCYDETLPPNAPQSKWCLASILAPIYFVIFVLMAQFVLVNVVVAVLMNNLDDSNKMQADDAEMDDEIEKQLEDEARNNIYNDTTLKMEDYFDNESMINFNKPSSLPPNFSYNLDIDSKSTTPFIEHKQNHSKSNYLTEQHAREYAELNKYSSYIDSKLKKNEQDFNKDRSINSLSVNKTSANNMFDESPIEISKTTNEENDGKNYGLRSNKTSCSSFENDPLMKNKISISNRIKQKQKNKENRTNNDDKSSLQFVSFKTHFSPRSSVRIRAIDETDTDDV